MVEQALIVLNTLSTAELPAAGKDTDEIVKQLRVVITSLKGILVLTGCMLLESYQTFWFRFLHERGWWTSGLQGHDGQSPV